MLIIEMCECIALQYHVKREGIRKIFYLSLNEKESNFNSYVLMKNGIHVYKIPTLLPLFFVHKIILTNTLIISCKYHEEELSIMGGTVIYDEFQCWPPYSTRSYFSRYSSINCSTLDNTLGFYSSGGYLRHYLNHNNTEFLLNNEDNLLKILVDYLTVNVEVELIVFLHPLEKKNGEYMDIADKYYKDLFKGIKFRYSDCSVSTTNSFETVDLAVSVYSTVTFERLYCGFKALIFSPDTPGFPIKNSGLDRICAKNKEELHKLIDKNKNIIPPLFFSENKIEDYCYSGKIYSRYLNNNNIRS